MVFWYGVGGVVVVGVDGESTDDRSGSIVSLSSDGSTVAIGAVDNHGKNGSESGHVRIYQSECTTYPPTYSPTYSPSVSFPRIFKCLYFCFVYSFHETDYYFSFHHSICLSSLKNSSNSSPIMISVSFVVAAIIIVTMLEY